MVLHFFMISNRFLSMYMMSVHAAQAAWPLVPYDDAMA